MDNTHVRLLVVDDDALYLRAVARQLGSRYTVRTASTREEAVSIAQKEPVDAVICDLVLSTASGFTVRAAIVEARPTLATRIAFASGTTLDAELQSQIEKSGCAFLPKPYTVDEIHAWVKRVAAIPPET